MNILPKKSWHVRNKDNVARVRRDEARAAEEEQEVRRRAERAEQEARTEYLRNKSRVALEQTGERRDEGGKSAVTEEHLNLFTLEDSSEKKGNAEYHREKKEEKEKQERAIGLLVNLGPAPGTDVTPWYLKERERDSVREKEEEEEKKRQEKRKRSITEEEREKKDSKLKDRLDPLKEMKKALAVKDKKQKKHKKERRDKEERSSVGSMEQLRAERLQRETEERKRAQALLAQKKGVDGEKDCQKQTDDRDRPYNSAFFPQLARKRQRRDRDQYNFL